MVRPAFSSLLLVALVGACAEPQPATTAGALPGAQTERFPNGDVYVGQMAGGLREGQGSYAWADGRRYVGGFRAGLEDGQGTYTYPNGEKYEGQFQANRRTGQGTYTWPDGRKYVGELRDDQPNGRGTFTAADGRRQSGLFRNGEYVATAAGVPATAYSGGEVALQRRGGTYVVPVEINGQPAIDFHIDSGAADVSVPAYLFQQMKAAGSLRPEDMLGSETYTLANGASIKAETFRIRQLKVGSIELKDVRASVSQYAGPPLLGMSFLGRFSSWSVDNGRSVLILK